MIPTLSRIDQDDVPERIAPEAGDAAKSHQFVQLAVDSARYTFDQRLRPSKMT